MHRHLSTLAPRLITGWLLALLCVLFTWSGNDLAAQKPVKKQEEEEEPIKKPLKKVPRVEEEEPFKARPKTPLRVGDEEPAPKRSRPDASPATRPVDLAREAEQTTRVALRDLYLRFAVPHDELYYTAGSGEPRRIEPLPERVGPGFRARSPLRVHIYDEKWKRGAALPVSAGDVKEVRPYEQVAYDQVRQLLEQRGPLKEVPRQEVLQAAEQVLSAVLRFHESARERDLRSGEGWDKLGRQLRDQLLDVQAEALAAYAEAKDWESAYALASRLSEAYTQPEAQAKLAQPMSRFVLQSLQEEQYAEARRRQRLLEDLFSGNSLGSTVADALSRKAAELFARAKQEQDKAKAEQLLATAETIWPRLVGLRDYRLQLGNAYPILHVGVNALPKNLSPATACTDAERQAVDLLFEGLVKSWYVKDVGQRYLPALAAERPRIIPLGREFHLSRDAFWSSDSPVTAVDVRRTVQLLRERGGADLIEEARPGTDPYHVTVALRQGFLDPLALMTFKIVPASLERLDDPAFARNPVGSGPYVLQRNARDPDSVQFIANHNYNRAGKAGLPRIREIRLFRPKDPVADFDAGRLHLLLDPPPDVVQRVQSLKQVRVKRLTPRRVYFLALNHRRPALQNEDLRRMLAAAIDREKVLNDVFRGDLKDDRDKPHRPLNGPYPPGSWAAKPELKADPYNLGLAKVLAGKCKDAVGAARLTLKYPDDDSRARRAIEAIQQQVQALGTGLELVPEARSPTELRREVEVEHNYDLAYYSFDYANESYWLWPLFDPAATGTGGRNYLGYQNDGNLLSLFRKTMDHREFAEVRKLTHEIHETIQARMPFVPLWQLDAFVAASSDLTTHPPLDDLDPLHVFNEVEHWELKRTR